MIRYFLSIGGLICFVCFLFGAESTYPLSSNYTDSYNYRISSAQVGVTILNGVSVPSDFPILNPTILKTGTAPGRLFLNNWGGTPYILILNNDGSPYFYQKVENRSRDFKVQANGMLTRRFFNDSASGFYVMDSTYSVVDTLMAVNGYETDEHELHILENGDYFLIALGFRQVNMAAIVEGGNPNATIIDNHIQGFDADNNLVFEWLSYEYFQIQDAWHENLTGSVIDYVHMNSIAVDFDGHLIVSSRHQNEVTKINRHSGDIIWRLGGLNNQFTIIGDPYNISYQHDARPVPGKPGFYTIFDNGNYRSPQFTRVIEYQIDTLAMTATKVWEYRHSPDRFTWWMGNAQRLPNGNTQINWADNSLPKFTEVTPAGEVVFEADFDSPVNTYRAFRFAWENPVNKPYLLAEAFPDKISLIFNLFGVDNVEGYVVYYGNRPHQLSILDTVATPYYNTSELNNNETYYFEVIAIDSAGGHSERSNQVAVFTRFVLPGENYILNGDFESGAENWYHWNFNGGLSSLQFDQGAAHVVIDDPGSDIWHVQLIQGNIPLINGRNYRVEFDAWSDTTRLISPRFERDGPDYENYSQQGAIILKKEPQNYQHEFTMAYQTDYQARLTFNLGRYPGDVYIDNISLVEVIATGLDDSEVLPANFNLEQNFPNPFNPTTIIRFQLGDHTSVELTVYNILGQKIRSLLDTDLTRGFHEVQWNGRDDDGREVGSGIYFYRLKTPSFLQTRKMYLLK